MNKMSQSGTFYKIIVTCVILGVNLSLSIASPQELGGGSPLFQFAPTREASSGLVGSELASASNLGINSEYNSFIEEGANPASLPGFVNYGQRGQRMYSRAPSPSAFPSARDELETAAQSYFIEPEQATTTTVKPSYKKRKTRRPISSLAEQKKPVLEVDGFHNNEAPQGGPPFNPFRQIVNTSFGRKRPSAEGKQERSRTRARQDVPAAVDNNNEVNESLNEIPSSTEGGPPRALGRRRPAQDVRPVGRPTTTFSSADNTDPPQNTRTFRPRQPADGQRRSFARRPRPTTTTSSDDDGTETSPPPQQPQRRKPLRPVGVSRFAPAANRKPVPTSTLTPSDSDVAPPPQQLPRRRPNKRPTTTAEAVPSQVAPEEFSSVKIISTSAPVTENVGDDTLPSPPKPIREGRQGFVLRPRPTQQAPPETSANEESSGTSGRLLTAQEMIATARPNLNRRRKRPTTTTGPAADSEYNDNHGFGGRPISPTVNEVIPSHPTPLRRAPSVFRGRPTPPPNAYPVREEQPNPQQISGAFGNSEDYGQHNSFLPNSPANVALMRRPTGPDSPSQGPPLQHTFNNNQPPSQLDSSFVPGLWPVSSPGNLEFWNAGLDNGLGAVPGNFRNGGGQGLHPHQFSSRAASTADENEPEISDSDTSPSGTEKTAVVSSPESENSETEANKPEQKLTPLQRLQNNRQAASRRFLTPRKTTEKPTPAPTNQKSGNLRKSIIPPRMLRPRGKLVEEKTVKEDEARETSSAAGGEEKSKEESGNINDSNAASSDDTDSNAVSISPKEDGEQETSSTKPSILDNAKRRRITLPASRTTSAVTQQKLKITPAPPPDHNPDNLPECEDGQRYSKFLKRCVTMYKPRAQG